MLNLELGIKCLSLPIYNEKGLRSLEDISEEIGTIIEDLENKNGYEYHLHRYFEPPKISPDGYVIIILQGVKRGE